MSRHITVALSVAVITISAAFAFASDSHAPEPSSPFVAPSTGCEEIRSAEDLRQLLSTDKQVWIIFYDESSVRSQEAKRHWARFASTVTRGFAADVGAINAVKYPGLAEMQEFDINSDDLPAVRYFELGSKYETVQENGDSSEVIEYDDAPMMKPKVFNDDGGAAAIRYSELKKRALHGVFRSRVFDRNVSSQDALVKLVDATSLKEAAVLVSPSVAFSGGGDDSGDDESDDEVIAHFDGIEFGFHWVSRVFMPNLNEGTYGVNDMASIFDATLAFVIVEAESPVGRFFLSHISPDDDDGHHHLTLPALFLFNSTSEEVKRYKESKVDNPRAVAQYLTTLRRPPPSENTTPLPSCPTLAECFQKYPTSAFVVHNAPEIFQAGNPKNTYEAARKACLAATSDDEIIQSIDPLSGDIVEMPIAEAMARFENKTLYVNIVDGKGVENSWDPPPVMTRNQKVPNKLVILSPAGSFTLWHIDPVQGLGFQVIWKGSKYFEFIDPKHAKTLGCDSVVHGGTCLKSPAEVALENQKKGGEPIEIFAARVNPGDAIFWNGEYLHQVWTDEATFAANGFVNP